MDKSKFIFIQSGEMDWSKIHKDQIVGPYGVDGEGRCEVCHNPMDWAGGYCLECGARFGYIVDLGGAVWS